MNSSAETIGHAVTNAARALLPAAGEDASFEARCLVAFVMGKSRIDVSEYSQIFPGKYSEALILAVNSRLTGEPLQYILGEWQFMGLPITLRRCCLIPRQDTETLAEAAISLARLHGFKTCLDVCTGSGCVAAAIAKNTAMRVTASDISADCAAVARINAERNGVCVEVVATDLFLGLGRFDLITANPPYIKTGDIPTLQAEVLKEPVAALDGGEDGLCFYRRMANEAPDHIQKNGAIAMEVGANQGDAVRKLFENIGFSVETVRDLCGIERVVIAKAFQ